MADGDRSRSIPQGQNPHALIVGTPAQSESFCTLRNQTPRMALSPGGLGCCIHGICRATIPIAIRAPCGKDGAMKRAARHKTGSVVFDKRRKTWNFLWWEGGKRRSRLIGTLKEF